eukprot:5626623-Alexandrium_andersonii.AAC.1
MPCMQQVEGVAVSEMPDAYTDASVSPPGKPWEAIAGLGAWITNEVVEKAGWASEPQGMVLPEAVDFSFASGEQGGLAL